MKDIVFKLLNIKYPQNYIIRHPFQGAIIIAVFIFVFSSLYKPLDINPSASLSFTVTVILYSIISAISIILSVRILKIIRYFSNINTWTILKELLSVFCVLIGLGIFIYFIGFIIESPFPRWNIATFLDSIKRSFLIGIIPFIFFTALNYRYLISKKINYNEESNYSGTEVLTSEDLIHISSQLKKEELSFYPSQFIYAESDGNYVIFYLNKNNLVKKEIIRNSISNIEQQLSEFPYFLRTHRAFIVNLKKVKRKQGNILGYKLTLADADFDIPVSRNNIETFNRLFPQYRI